MRNRTRRGAAMIIALMVVLGLVLLGSMIILTIDNVVHRAGTFRRLQSGHPCAEEGLNLGRAWLLQTIQSSPNIDPRILVGTAPGHNATPGNGLLADPTDQIDLSNPAKDLCQIAGPVTIGGVANVPGLKGLCRIDPNATCAAPPCAAYRINLVDDVDEILPTPLNPWVDTNHTFLIRSECLDTNSMQATTGVPEPQVEVASVEVNQSGGGCPGGNSLQAQNAAGCGGGTPN